MSKKKRIKNRKLKFLENEPNTQQKKDTSPLVHQRSNLDHYVRIINRELTPKQKEYIDLISKLI
jgi:hypothetical protein